MNEVVGKCRRGVLSEEGTVERVWMRGEREGFVEGVDEREGSWGGGVRGESPAGRERK